MSIKNKQTRGATKLLEKKKQLEFKFISYQFIVLISLPSFLFVYDTRLINHSRKLIALIWNVFFFFLNFGYLNRKSNSKWYNWKRYTYQIWKCQVALRRRISGFLYYLYIITRKRGTMTFPAALRLSIRYHVFIMPRQMMEMWVVKEMCSDINTYDRLRNKMETLTNLSLLDFIKSSSENELCGKKLKFCYF